MTINRKSINIKNASPPASAPRSVVADEMVRAQAEALRVQTEIVRAQSAQVQALVASYADVGHATAELLRSRASAIARQRPRRPPPVTTHLHRFAEGRAQKTAATIALLTEEQRTRLGALVPAFTSAALANEPDVVATVVRWFDLPPEGIARDLVSNLDAFERRFAP